MKFPALSILLMVFLISCNSPGKKEQAVPLKKDSSITVSPPNINPYAPVDISPMDMSYFPADYPKLKMAKMTSVPPLARVIYSRPHLQGRHIFHEVLRYGEPWRMGANESTELDLYKETSIAGKKVSPGRYILYCIPQTDKWTVVLNSNIDSWGLQPDPSKDIDRFVVPVNTIPTSIEYFTMVFEKTNTGADLLMAWDNAEARLPFVF